MEGRDLARESNYDDYVKNPEFVKEVSLEEHLRLQSSACCRADAR